MVNIVNRFYTHLGDKPLGMSVREFPGELIDVGRPTITMRGAFPIGWGSGWNKLEKES